jgi:nucleotide-binding universal stress UspA family protein
MVNIARILCPVDFSDASRHALEQATVIAGWFEASLTVLHVHSEVFLPVPGLAMPGYSAELPLEAEQRKRAVDEANEFVAPARAAGVKVDLAFETGLPTPHILAAAARQIDLIVMGTHGTSGFEHFMLGSVTEKVLRKAPCPVLTVPPRARATSRLPLKRILCATDFSDSSLTALGLALAFAKESDARLTIVHVLEWPVEQPAPAASVEAPVGGPIFDLEGYRRMLEADAAERLKTLVPADAREWCTPETRVLHGKPWAKILETAASEETDLIVLGVRGRNAFDMLLFGSTANQVVRQATCPVLTVKR